MSIFSRGKHAKVEEEEPEDSYGSHSNLYSLTELLSDPGDTGGSYGASPVFAPPLKNGCVVPSGTDLNYNPVESPDHYSFPGGAQVIDITRHLGFLEGNVIKYVARAGRKGDRKEDLLKAQKYLDWAIEEAI